MRKASTYTQTAEDELAALQQQENFMVAEEQYEEAAKIRDKIFLHLLHERLTPKLYGNSKFSETLLKVLTLQNKYTSDITFSPEFGENVLDTTKLSNTLLLHRVLKTQKDNILDLGNGQMIYFTGKEAVLLAYDLRLLPQDAGVDHQRNIYDREQFNVLPNKKFNNILIHRYNGNVYIFISYFTKIVNDLYVDEEIGYFIANKDNTLYYTPLHTTHLSAYNIQNRCCELVITDNKLNINYGTFPPGDEHQESFGNGIAFYHQI